jgi:hypothetical protein
MIKTYFKIFIYRYTLLGFILTVLISLFLSKKSFDLGVAVLTGINYYNLINIFQKKERFFVSFLEFLPFGSEKMRHLEIAYPTLGITNKKNS